MAATEAGIKILSHDGHELYAPSGRTPFIACDGQPASKEEIEAITVLLRCMRAGVVYEHGPGDKWIHYYDGERGLAVSGSTPTEVWNAYLVAQEGK